MVLKALNLARLSLSKAFTHGSAQSLVAGYQSSYASQNNNPFSSFTNGFANRYNKGSSLQHHAAFASQTQGASGKSAQNDQLDSLAAYLVAWHKQRLSDREWRQYQFAKRIEWKAPEESAEEAAVAEAEADQAFEASQDGSEDAATRGLTRSYSSGDLESWKKVGDVMDSDVAAIAKEHEELSQARKQHAQTTLLDTEQTSKSGVERHSSSETSLSDAVFTVGSEEAPLTPTTPVSHSEQFEHHLMRLASSGKWMDIAAVFESMLRTGVKPTATAYNALLQAAINIPVGKHQRVPKALAVYSDMLKRGVAPTLPIYTQLINLLSSRTLDVQAMRKLLLTKQTRYGGEGWSMFRSDETELEILNEDDSLPLAVRIFQSAVKSYAGPLDGESYRLLISACANEGKVDDMVRVYEHMEKFQVTPLADTHVKMILAFGRSGDLKSAVETYNEYRALAIENNNGTLDMSRKDSDIYAAVVQSYLACGRIPGADRFIDRIQESLPAEQVAGLRDAVSLQAKIPQLLQANRSTDALELAEQLSPTARDLAMALVAEHAADRDDLDIAVKAFKSIVEPGQVPKSAIMALAAMHAREGSLDAHQYMWDVINFEQMQPSVEAVTLHALFLMQHGNMQGALSATREMFKLIRNDAHGSSEVTERMDESIHVLHDLTMKASVLPAEAKMDFLWLMVENGGLIRSVAEHTLARMGPEDVATLSPKDLLLLVQIQSSIVASNPQAADLASSSRLAHAIDQAAVRGVVFDERTLKLIEEALTKTKSVEISQALQSFRFPVAPVVAPTPQHAFAQAYQAPFEDSFDPYGKTTDNKGSVAITELLEKTYGKSSSHFNEALQKFRNMRRAGRHPRYFTYAKLIAAAAKEHRFTDAQEILATAYQDLPPMPQYRIVKHGWATILDSMVAACLTTGRRHLAGDYHRQLLEMGATPSANTFGLYITTLKEGAKTFDEASEAVRIFLQSKTEGVEPSSFLYNALIGKLGKARRIDDCLFYFTEMRSLGIRPTSVTYGTIVNALCRVSDEKFAEELFEEMESMPNYKPRPAPYHSLMQFFLTTKRDRSKVLAYYERMRAHRIEPTSHTFKLLIDTHATLDPVDLPAAERVLDELHASPLAAEPVHYASLIHANGCVLHDLPAARALFDRVLADRLAAPSPCLYQALFESMVANHAIAPETVDALLDDMALRRVELTPYIANSLIHGWAVAGEVDRAKKVYENVPRGRREPSTYEAMTRAFMAAERREEARGVVEEAVGRGYPAAVAGKIADLVGA
ncbi:hypothetical protein P152DRAFT_393611 [Eremomyces bilateralis CBS 781.70]|uniref:Tetratricopeptide repeat domain-containing protein n=1 Tax=Eremomyces bilateralis CBS 781.70 TaxID=1392243 RepID=A0A6G1G862_9PEZI|nr:uncharacterized protein P152DRAFT_393611 [Eremomyces bilateralis CBS 781.70]KAF1814213.1 hypothetical protein P152DRAFT_393611 [Eremomyces bilateralis CBS 781.70]